MLNRRTASDVTRARSRYPAVALLGPRQVRQDHAGPHPRGPARRWCAAGLPRPGEPGEPCEARGRLRLSALPGRSARHHRRGPACTGPVRCAARRHRRPDPGGALDRTLPAARLGLARAAASVERKPGGAHRLPGTRAARCARGRARSSHRPVGPWRLPARAASGRRRDQCRLAHELHHRVCPVEAPAFRPRRKRGMRERHRV